MYVSMTRPIRTIQSFLLFFWLLSLSLFQFNFNQWGTFWDEPLQNDEQRKLFESEENDLYTALAQMLGMFALGDVLFPNDSPPWFLGDLFCWWIKGRKRTYPLVI